jgi:hypothetical protein
MDRKILGAFFIVLAGAAQAQLATVTDEHGNVVTNGMFVHLGDDQTSNQEASLYVTLNGSSNKTVNVRRYEVDVDAGTQNYFCWGVCYGPVDAGQTYMWQAQPDHALLLEPGVEVSNFHAYHSPMGVMGTSVYRYVWFDVANTNDSVYVDVHFMITGVGVPENATTSNLNVYPNPVIGKEMQLEFQTGSANGGTVILRDAIGQVVASHLVRSNNGRITIPTEGLQKGVYFATIENNGKILVTRRVVISN